MTIAIEIEKPKVRFVNIQMNTLRIGTMKNHLEAGILTFKTDLDLKEGDGVVCDTRFGLRLGKVLHYVPIDDEYMLPQDLDYKFIVQKVDLTPYNNRLTKAKRLKALEFEMRKRIEKAAYINPFSELAKTDPEMAKMVEEYKELSDEF